MQHASCTAHKIAHNTSRIGALLSRWHGGFLCFTQSMDDLKKVRWSFSLEWVRWPSFWIAQSWCKNFPLWGEKFEKNWSEVKFKNLLPVFGRNILKVNNVIITRVINNVRHDILRTSKKFILEWDRKINTFPRFFRIYSIQLKRKARKEPDSNPRRRVTRLRNPKRKRYKSRAKSYFQKITVQT